MAIATYTDLNGFELLGEEVVFEDTRIPVRFLFDYLNFGATIEAFIKDYPSVSFEIALKTINIGLQQLQQYFLKK